MAERRKIIIEMGARPGEPLQTPHFDAEATLTARPVVPLSEQQTAQLHYAPYGAPLKPFWKRPALVALILLGAVGIGVGAGLGIGIYRSRKAAETPAANSQEAAPVEKPNTGQAPEPVTPATAPRASTSVPEQSADPAADPKDESRESTRANGPVDDGPERPVRDRKPKVEEKAEDEADAEEVLAERQAERQRRREERRERRTRNREREDETDIPRQIERAGRREIDRIRDIFEGRQP